MRRAWAVPIFGWGLLVGVLLRPTLNFVEARTGYIPDPRRI